MHSIYILLIEDDADDIELLEEAFKDNHIDYTLDTLIQGDEVLPFLEKCTSLPDVIVMDLNLPKLHGRELIPMIKSSARFGDIPIVVLTTSSAEAEVNFCLEAGAHTFLTKPVTVENFRLTVQAIAAAAQSSQQV